MSSPYESAIVHTLFHFLWEGAVVSVVLALALRLFGRTARVRYGLACLAMLAMPAAFGITLAWFWPHVPASHAIAQRVLIPASMPTADAWTEIPVHANDNQVLWVAPLWMLGVALFSLRSLAAWFAAMRLKRRGVAAAAQIWKAKLEELAERVRVLRPVMLLESCLTDVPVVIGFLKPVILVPAQLLTGFPPEQLELILIHELAHIRRHDYLVNLVQSLVEDLLFYHPGVWWVSRVIRAEREKCCDDVVVASTGNAHQFAEALAALEQNRWAMYETALAANGGSLMNRIHRLLSGRDRSRVVATPVLFASLLPVALAVAATVVKAQSPASVPPIPLPPAPHAPVLLAQAVPPTPATVQQTARAEDSRLTAELETPYKKWLNQDVVYIISDEERKAFGRLTTDAERDQFIEQFWLRRDPTPNTPENEYREEHYRRIAYATESFSSGVPGWKTDRGMIYIKYGPPDEREEHPKGGTYERPIEEGGGQTTTFPFEKWRYRYIEGIGNDVNIEFVDTTLKGEYHMTMDPAEKDALLYVPGAGLTLAEQLGLANKDDRFTRTDGTHLGTGTMPLPAVLDQFKRLQQFANLQKPPRQVVPAQDAIEDIIFQGDHRRYPTDFLRNVIRTRPGDKYDKLALDHDVTMLLNTHAFEKVDWNFARGQTGWIVTFTVVEKQIERH